MVMFISVKGKIGPFEVYEVVFTVSSLIAMIRYDMEVWLGVCRVGRETVPIVSVN